MTMEDYELECIPATAATLAFGNLRTNKKTQKKRTQDKMTLFIEVKREQNPFTRQLHYRATALNTYGIEWKGDGIDGNRQQAISKCFIKYENQGYSTYHIN